MNNNNLVKCKTCQKEVSKSAKLCPNCGEKYPGISSKESLKALAFIAIFFIIFLFVVIGGKDKEVKESHKVFNFTYQEFLQRYNKSIRTLDPKTNISFKMKEKTDNGEFLTLQFVSDSELLGMIGEADNKTDAMRSVVFICGGDGSMSSGVTVMFGLASVIMAIENPDMPLNQRKSILEDLGITNNKLINTGKVETVRQNKYKYSISKTEKMGIWLTATPI